MINKALNDLVLQAFLFVVYNYSTNFHSQTNSFEIITFNLVFSLHKIVIDFDLN